MIESDRVLKRDQNAVARRKTVLAALASRTEVESDDALSSRPVSILEVTGEESGRADASALAAQDFDGTAAIGGPRADVEDDPA